MIQGLFNQGIVSLCSIKFQLHLLYFCLSIWMISLSLEVTNTKVYNIICLLNQKITMKYLSLHSYFLGIRVHYLPNKDLSITFMNGLLKQKWSFQSLCLLLWHLMQHFLLLLVTILRVQPFIEVLLGLSNTLLSLRLILLLLWTKCVSSWKNPWFLIGTIKRILKYLQVSIHHGVFFKPISQLLLQGFIVTNWVTFLDYRRLVSGTVLYYGANPIFWCSRKQYTVSQLKTKAQ